MKLNRREFAKLATMGALAATQKSFGSPSDTDRLEVHVFSKVLEFLDYKEMAEAAAEAGYDGVDLTVRPGGHVLPERAEDDLPRAAEAIEAAGLKKQMIVTRVTNANDELGIRSLEIASRLGFKDYRMGYMKYDRSLSWQDNLDTYRRALEELRDINQSLNLHGAYQNHSGVDIGAYIGDLVYMMQGFDRRWIGCQYDIRHATVEGGTAWPLALHYIWPHIKTIAVKDFIWEQGKGSLKIVNVPLGEGVVDYVGYFKKLRSYGVRPIVTIHLEYDLGGAEHGHDKITIPQEEIFAAMRRDVKTLHRLWAESAD